MGSFAKHIGYYADCNFEANSDSEDITTMITKEKEVTETSITNMVTTMTVQPINNFYIMHCKFTSVNDIMNNFDLEIAPHKRKHKLKFRKHLGPADSKKISRIKEIVAKDRVEKKNLIPFKSSRSIIQIIVHLSLIWLLHISNHWWNYNTIHDT